MEEKVTQFLKVFFIGFLVVGLLTILYESLLSFFQKRFSRQAAGSTSIDEARRRQQNDIGERTHQTQAVLNSEAERRNREQIQRLRRAIPSASLDQPRYPETKLEQDRRIRKEQEREFERALAIDREKENKRMEEERQRMEEERQRMEEERRIQFEKELREERKLVRSQKYLTYPPEPSESEDLVHLQIRLPDGTRLSRRFRKEEQISNLFDFVDGHMTSEELLDIAEFKLVSHYPKRVHVDVSKTLQESGFFSQDSVFVEGV